MLASLFIHVELVSDLALKSSMVFILILGNVINILPLSYFIYIYIHLLEVVGDLVFL